MKRLLALLLASVLALSLLPAALAEELGARLRVRAYIPD